MAGEATTVATGDNGMCGRPWISLCHQNDSLLGLYTILRIISQLRAWTGTSVIRQPGKKGGSP